jgi:NAD+ kinase
MGARVEIDGHETALAPRTFDIALRADYATLVRIGGEEEYLAGLRRRRIIMDSPRVLARDDRAAASAAGPPGPAPGSGSRRPPD